MSGRCKACDNVLKDHEMLSKTKGNKALGVNPQHEEMCRFCINASFDRGIGPVVAHISVPLIDGLANGPGIYDD